MATAPLGPTKTAKHHTGFEPASRSTVSRQCPDISGHSGHSSKVEGKCPAGRGSNLLKSRRPLKCLGPPGDVPTFSRAASLGGQSRTPRAARRAGRAGHVPHKSELAGWPLLLPHQDLSRRGAPQKQLERRVVPGVACARWVPECSLSLQPPSWSPSTSCASSPPPSARSP